MGSALDWILLAIALAQAGLIAFMLTKRSEAGAGGLDRRLARTESLVKEEAERARRAASEEARQSREESGRAVMALGETLQARVREFAQTQGSANEAFAGRVDRLAESVDAKLNAFQAMAAAHREQLTGSLDTFRQEVGGNLAAFGDRQQAQFNDARARDAELNERLSQALVQRVAQINVDMAAAWERFSGEIGKLQASVTTSLGEIRKDNEERLERMRATVDEKLHNTLEQRLGESFKIVSERLESVQKGLGEMQALATGVGDLKKVLTNVKTRGTWGEVLLGNLLEQVLPPELFAANVAVTGTSERVEYAVKLPGRGEREAGPVWLPMDSKFPKEDYERLVAAQEAADAEGAAEAGAGLERAIRAFGATICEKYIETPKTTDFAIMFLPSESLYAEVIRRTETVEHLQRSCRVVVAGPTTLAALLNSLLMGFRTLAIQRRSSEVWEVLGSVKAEFGKYGTLMAKVQKKLQEATNTIDKVGVRTRAINRTLSEVEKLGDADTLELFPPRKLLEDELTEPGEAQNP